ncbi:MAG: hypothetical protein OJF58_000018 [Enhydrobacter sp.]|nr:MAG: hypothetical protein OJF58_000018 [Enhydrobacter sp.]
MIRDGARVPQAAIGATIAIAMGRARFCHDCLFDSLERESPQ